MRQLPSSPLLNRPLAQADANLLYRMYPETKKTSSFFCPTCGKNLGGGKNGTIFWGGETWECNCADQLQRYKHYLNAGIGRKYHDLGFNSWGNDDFDIRRLDKYRDNIQEYIRYGVGLCLYGTNGVGKTLVGALILKELIRDYDYKCYMTTASDLIELVRGGWKSEESKAIYRDKIDGAHVLFIDDIGKELMGSDNAFNDKHAKMAIENIVRNRVQDKLPTFFTTNMSEAEINSGYTTQGLGSLLQESSKFVKVEGVDFRSTVGGMVDSMIAQGITRPIF